MPTATKNPADYLEYIIAHLDTLYEAGDNCPCGRGLPVLGRIIGREQDMVTLPGGDKRWTLLSTGNIQSFLEIAPIRQYQFVQKDLQTIEALKAIDIAGKVVNTIMSGNQIDPVFFRHFSDMTQHKMKILSGYEPGNKRKVKKKRRFKRKTEE